MNKDRQLLSSSEKKLKLQNKRTLHTTRSKENSNFNVLTRKIYLLELIKSKKGSG